MTISEGDVARSSRSVENSEIKRELEDDGGRYTVRRIKEKPDVVVTRTHRDSKDEKLGNEILEIF